ncbi:MAG: PrsW family intramembrane metalloprotease [Armatimonadetes bacterium]|nr:PrsW family intramembrane metalloprotease [Armatimonadota bacterium]MDW8154491.1 PrsW family intramembrane metalloprotease [Armatimonadota bacterium]
MEVTGARLTLGPDTFVKALGLVGSGLILFVLAFLQMALFYQAAGGFARFLMASFAALSVVPFYAGLILLLDRHEKEPGWLLLGALLWGGVVATFFSLVFNTVGSVFLQLLFGPQLGRQLSAPFLAPLTEETSKGFAVLLIFFLWRREFTNTVDGLVYGALAGLGFAATENILYFAKAIREGGLTGLTLGFVLRAVVGGLGHSVYTACTGAGLGYARETMGPARYVAPVAGYFCAVFLHFLWNLLASFALPAAVRSVGDAGLLLVPLMAFVIEGIPLLFLVVLAYFAWRREVAAIQEGLREEIEAGRMAAEHVALLTRPRERGRRLWSALTTRGPGAWNLLRQLYDAEVDLAFALWRQERGEGGRDVQALRERVHALRERVEALGLV